MNEEIEKIRVKQGWENTLLTDLGEGYFIHSSKVSNPAYSYLNVSIGNGEFGELYRFCHADNSLNRGVDYSKYYISYEKYLTKFIIFCKSL